MSQRLVDPVAASVERDVLEPLKSYFKHQPFYYDPYERRDDVGKSFERYVRSKIARMVSDISDFDSYSVSRMVPDCLISDDKLNYISAKKKSVFGGVKNKVVEIMPEGNFAIYNFDVTDGLKMRQLTEIDDFLRYRKKGTVDYDVPIIFEATVSKKHDGMSPSRKSDLISKMVGQAALYVGVQMGDTPSTKLFDNGRFEKKMVVGSVPLTSHR